MRAGRTIPGRRGGAPLALLLIGAGTSLAAVGQAQPAGPRPAKAPPAATATASGGTRVQVVPLAQASETPASPPPAGYPPSSPAPPGYPAPPAGSGGQMRYPYSYPAGAYPYPEVRGEVSPGEERPTAAARRQAPARAPARIERYWGQIVIADVSAIGLALAGAASGKSGPVVLGLTGYLLVPPIMHGVNDSAGKAFGSFALRVGMPLVGLLFSTRSNCAATNTRENCEEGVFVGFLAGFVGAMVLDAAVLAQKEPEPDHDRPKVTPVIALDRTGGTVGLGGTW